MPSAVACTTAINVPVSSSNTASTVAGDYYLTTSTLCPATAYPAGALVAAADNEDPALLAREGGAPWCARPGLESCATGA